MDLLLGNKKKTKDEKLIRMSMLYANIGLCSRSFGMATLRPCGQYICQRSTRCSAESSSLWSACE